MSLHKMILSHVVGSMGWGLSYYIIKKSYRIIELQAEMKGPSSLKAI